VRDPTREEALAHFGVRGMHWGVRKDTSSSGPTKKQLAFRDKLDNLGPGKELRIGKFGRTTVTREVLAKPITLPDGRVISDRIGLSTTSRSGQAKFVAGEVGKIALRVGLVGVLSSVGVPAAVAGLGAVATVAANPEMVTVGKENAKQFLDQHGIHTMSAVDKVKSVASEAKAKATINLRNRDSGR
jgi:hypothetical protein